MSQDPTIIQRSLYGFSRSTNGTIGAGTSAITCAMFVFFIWLYFKISSIYCSLKFNQFCWIRTFLVYLLFSLTTFTCTYWKINIFTYLPRPCSCQFLLLKIDAIILWLENTMIFCPFISNHGSVAPHTCISINIKY